MKAGATLWNVVREFIWPESDLGKLGRVLGALSVLKLAEFGFDYGFGATFTLILGYYETLAHILIGSWAEPILRAWLADLSDYLSLDLHLFPHWKHIFLLLGFYFFRDAQIGYGIGPGNAVFHFVLGAAVAALAGIGAGLIPLSQSDPWLNFKLGAIPIIGLLAYGLIGRAWGAAVAREFEPRVRHLANPTWWDAFKPRAVRGLVRALVGLAFLFGALQIPYLQSVPGIGLALLAVWICLFGFYWLWEGTIDVKFVRRSDESWATAYWRTSAAKVGAAMLGTFLTAIELALLNAGLQPFNL